MKIVDYTVDLQDKLEAFKSVEWPLVDLEHYGDDQPDFSRESYTLIAQEEDGRLVGYVKFIVDTGVVYVDSLIVGKNFQRQGVATKLMRVVEDKAREMGSHKIWLETGSDWQAKSLYDKLGYGVRVILPNHYGGREFVIMDKMLI